MFSVSCTPSPEMKIMCDCESRHEGQFIAINGGQRFSETSFANANNQSRLYSRSGNFSESVYCKSPFGMTYKIGNALTGEGFKVTCWRHRSNQNGSLVAACENLNHFYASQNKSSGKVEGDWEEIQLEFRVPASASTKDIVVYAYSTDTIPVYFDDLTIESQGQSSSEIKNETSSFIDGRDVNKYSIVKLNDDWWMAENLNYPKSDSLFCYENRMTYGRGFGKLYSYYSACKVCPDGWQLPTDADWKRLERYLGMRKSECEKYGQRGYDEGIKLKEFGSSGFSAKLAGAYAKGFYNLHRAAYFWTATESDTLLAFCRELNDKADVGRYLDKKNMKFSVRCIKKKQQLN